MSLPISFPPSEGPGRLTEVATYKKAPNASPDALMSVLTSTSKFPSFRQVLKKGSDCDDETELLIFDWTSEEEKFAFQNRPDNEQFKSAKAQWDPIIDKSGESLVCYHVTLPGSTVTPQCNYYEVATLTIPQANHPEVAKAMDKYSKDIGDGIFKYFAVGASKENPDVLVIIMGFDDTKQAEIADKSDEHLEAKKTNDPLVQGWSKFKAHLKKVAF